MRILFATLAADGHVNPLTAIAVRLRESGHDVRWYTGSEYAGLMERLAIPLLPYRRADQRLDAESLAGLPERQRLHGPALIRFDFERVFLDNVERYLEDIADINVEFPFDVMFCDTAFLAARLVREVLGKHVCGVGVSPSIETSKDLPPNFLGKQPARTAGGRLVHRSMAAVMDRTVLAHGRGLYNSVLAKHGLAPVTGSIFDEFYRGQDVIFQSGVPGFDYPRRDVNPRVRFVGALLPHHAGGGASGFPYADLVGDGQRVVLVSQGTVDNHDPGKLIAPALDALVGTGALLVVGTGRRNTEDLRRRYPQANVVIEDYVDFHAVLRAADLFVCNGGYGSVLISLTHGVPLVTAGTREGKNDINARVDYFGVGIDLRTEKPSSSAIAAATQKVLTEPRWKSNAMRLSRELADYHPLEAIEGYLAETLPGPWAQRVTGEPVSEPVSGSVSESVVARPDR
jgi:UDP:flavonoid glycosyltransferase YjiC (YdhE family)